MEVLLAWNHPQFDDAGARVIHEDLLKMLSNPGNGAHKRTDLDGDILTLPQTRPLLPTPIQSLLSLPVDLKYFVKAFCRENHPQFLNQDVSQAMWCLIRSSPYKTQFRAFYIGNASLLAMLALCRQNETMITGLLNRSAFIAFLLYLDSTAAPVFQSSTIIDYRRSWDVCRRQLAGLRRRYDARGRIMADLE
ncbi:hypothetical protein F4861DRAFT_536089 [Xylaria intraflava]|nr:hypothetical protein F4861DRAFT_536089 [Xylaria intraflava]